jgi:hypothetical protein
MAMFLVWGMSLAAMIRALLPLSNRSAKITMLLSVIAAVSIYAVSESGPEAIVALCFTFGPAALIAVSRLLSALLWRTSLWPSRSPAEAVFGARNP